MGIFGKKLGKLLCRINSPLMDKMMKFCIIVQESIAEVLLIEKKEQCTIYLLSIVAKSS